MSNTRYFGGEGLPNRAPAKPKNPHAKPGLRFGEPNGQPVPPAYIGIPAAAKYLDLAEKTIRRMIERGDIQAYKYGNRVLKVKLADLDAVYEKVTTKK